MTLRLPALTAEVLDAVPTITPPVVLLLVQELDAPALSRLIARSPGLTSIRALSVADRSSVLDESTVLALRQAHPRLTINGTWYDENAVQRLTDGVLAESLVQPAAPADPVELTVDNFDELIAGDKPVLVYFTGVGCSPCAALKPTIHELAGELADKLVVGSLDIMQQRPIAQRYRINAIPALLVFQRSGQLARIGSQEKDQILEMLTPVL